MEAQTWVKALKHLANAIEKKKMDEPHTRLIHDMLTSDHHKILDTLHAMIGK
jgi:hypothetical protein